MKIILRPYQQELYDKIVEAIPIHKKVLCQAATGYGKSYLIAKLANELSGRVLVLTHRAELLRQNSELMENVGILTANVKKNEPLKLCKIVAGMAQTANARFNKYGSDYVGCFDYVIVDETHLDFFEKVYNKLNFKNLIGFTATPVLNKNETKTINGIEFVRKLTLKDKYDILIEGISEIDLIEMGYLTEDFNIMLTPPNLDKLKNSNSTPDGYTSASLTEVFGSSASIKTVFSGYSQYGKGKKTIIFNPTTASNLKVYNHFKEQGINCKMYDSVNKTDDSRNEIVEWFKSTPGAVLCNAAVFTTGFSVCDLEVIIMNKATKSLGLYLQILGRGSRITNKIYKPNFLVLDCGLNIENFGRWSKKRDWQSYFKIQKWKRKKESDGLNLWSCSNCGFYNEVGSFYNEKSDRIECEGCGEPKPAPKPAKNINGKFVVMQDPPIPSAKKIIEYVKRNNYDGNMVFKLFNKQIVDLFIYHTNKNHFVKNQGKYKKRIAELFRPVYFSVLNDKELKGKNRRLNTELENIFIKIEKLY